MLIEAFYPTPLTANIIESYWFLRAKSSSTERPLIYNCLPTGTIELIIHLDDNRSEYLTDDQWEAFPEAFVVGLKEKPIMWRMPVKGTALFGIRFKPEALVHLFEFPVSGLLNKFVDATVFLGKEKISLISKIQQAADNQKRIYVIEIFLKAHQMTTWYPVKSYFSRAASIIRHANPSISIDQLSKDIRVSERHLQRMFKVHLGVSPKTYLSLIRFQKVYQFLQTNPGVSLSEVAYNFGFSDQAHFIRDFKKYSGKTPKVALLN